MEKLYRLCLKDGLMRYKFKNSKEKNILDLEEVKGSIFVYRSKEDMVSSKGIVLTSEEALKENRNTISHWTPNIYCYGTYIDNNRKITKGHFERNLKQINTFYIDFDTNDINECDILSVSYELGFMPTTIIKTKRGYQAYYVLKSPVYVTKHTDYKAVDVAKKISINIRSYFHRQNLPVDRMCNHFGIARFPTKENVVYFDKNNVYSFSNWLNWSIKEDDRLDSNIKKELYIISGSKGIKQINEKWFSLLLNADSKLKGHKNLLGRNDVLFTLALACYSSGLTEAECTEKLQIFNDKLEEALKEKEYRKIIASAYSSKYTGANRDYILMLCRTWIDENLTSKDLFTYQVWTKFKKKRTERKRSHYEEWEQDILKLIDKQDEIYLEIKKQDIIDSLNIPKRSLDMVLKNLHKRNVILYKATAGRYDGIKIALIKKVYSNIIALKKNQKERYILNLVSYFETSVEAIYYLIMNYQAVNYKVKISLFEEDVGKGLIIS